MRVLVKDALKSSEPREALTLKGWIRTRRDAKGFSFLELNDGSCLASIQVVVDEKAAGYNRIAEFTTGASAVIEGALVRSPAKGQTWEVHARAIELAGSAEVSYPLQKKGHSLEFLRTIAHLRPRSNLFGAVFRTRSRVAAAVHRFFQERDFVYVHTPIITSSDCEGAGELFRVVTRPATDATPAEFFGRPAFLTVSGQLEAEILACALSNVYTFGPTFRAENSNTSRHASEFWMIEPEMAFCDLDANATLAEEFIRETTRATLETCQEDLEFFSRFVEKDLLNRLQALIDRKFERLAYADAIKILLQSKKQFEHPVEYGLNLQSEHERFLTEEHFKAPVVVCNYPKQIKPFYMRLNDDGETVAAMDILVPQIGEIVGGSQREERLSVLESQLRVHNINAEQYQWYVDLRRYGTVPHAGFGVGFERLLMLLTGMHNIRDVIPFPRTPGSAEF